VCCDSTGCGKKYDKRRRVIKGEIEEIGEGKEQCRQAGR
jgi:hypothetical protein